MLHAAITNSYYGMEYMLYGKNTAGSARGGVKMKTVSGKTGKPGRGGTAEPEGRRTAGRFFCVCTVVRARQDISAGSGK